MKKFPAIAAGAMALAAASVSLAGERELVTQEFGLAGFDRISVAGVYEIDVQVGEDYSIRLSGPDYEVDRLEVSVKDGALVLDQRKRKKGEKKHNNRQGIDAVITMPSLSALSVSGVIDGTITGVDSKEFELDISGVGDISIDGECATLKANLSGVGDLDAKKLECAAVDVKVSGVGDARVFARDSVNAQVSGMGDIDIYGSPKDVRKNKGMFADITVH